MANKLGITEGNWWLRDSTAGGTKGYQVCWSQDEECITDFVYEYNDGVLMCDAGNTAQKCGLLPSELLTQRDELLEALNELVNIFNPNSQSVYEFARIKIDKAKQAIKKATE